jgi:NADH:ubiquinone oxidoreductase subunit K
MMLIHFQLLAAALFCLGLYGVLARRSAVMVLMAVEIMLNAVNLNLVAYASFRLPPLMDGAPLAQGQVIVVFVITIAAAEVALALAMIMRLYRNRGSINVDEINLLKG